MDSTTAHYAQNADEAVDLMVSNNSTGVPLFIEQDGERYVNSALLTCLYASMAAIGIIGGKKVGETEFLNSAYVLAALDSRARGERLMDALGGK